MTGLWCAVSAMRSDSTQRSWLWRTHLVMHTGPMVVPAGQVTAVMVVATVSWKASPSGSEHPRLALGSATALTQLVAKGPLDMVTGGAPYMHKKGHTKAGSWADKGGVLGHEGV